MGIWLMKEGNWISIVLTFEIMVNKRVYMVMHHILVVSPRVLVDTSQPMGVWAGFGHVWGASQGGIILPSIHLHLNSFAFFKSFLLSPHLGTFSFACLHCSAPSLNTTFAYISSLPFFCLALPCRPTHLWQRSNLSHFGTSFEWELVVSRWVGSFVVV